MDPHLHGGPDRLHASAISMLDACLSHDTSTRVKAESMLRAFLSQPETPAILLRIALSPSIPLSNRQLAIVALKNHIETNWSVRFVGPETAETTKTEIRQAVLNALVEPESKIRVHLAHIVAKIAHFDWPEQWPSLVDSLMRFLQSENINLVHGAHSRS